MAKGKYFLKAEKAGEMPQHVRLLAVLTGNQSSEMLAPVLPSSQHLEFQLQETCSPLLVSAGSHPHTCSCTYT